MQDIRFLCCRVEIWCCNPGQKSSKICLYDLQAIATSNLLKLKKLQTPNPFILASKSLLMTSFHPNSCELIFEFLRVLGLSIKSRQKTSCPCTPSMKSIFAPVNPKLVEAHPVEYDTPLTDLNWEGETWRKNSTFKSDFDSPIPETNEVKWNKPIAKQELRILQRTSNPR